MGESLNRLVPLPAPALGSLGALAATPKSLDNDLHLVHAQTLEEVVSPRGEFHVQA
jgi:hypothetical protein